MKVKTCGLSRPPPQLIGPTYLLVVLGSLEVALDCCDGGEQG